MSILLILGWALKRSASNTLSDPRRPSAAAHTCCSRPNTHTKWALFLPHLFCFKGLVGLFYFCLPMTFPAASSPSPRGSLFLPLPSSSWRPDRCAGKHRWRFSGSHAAHLCRLSVNSRSGENGFSYTCFRVSLVQLRCATVRVVRRPKYSGALR